MKHSKLFHALVSLVFFFAAWELMSWLFKATPLLFPPPYRVFEKIVLNHSRLLHHTFATFKEMICGMFIAVLAAFTTAYLMLRYQLFKMVIEPIFVVIQCLPMFTLAPVFIMWFGWSFIAIVIPTAMMITFPLTLNIYKGLIATPKPFLDFFKAHNATNSNVLFKLRLPYALPQIFAGLRISSAIAGVGAIAGEWAGAQKGLGVYLQICRRNFDLEGVFGSIFCLLVLSMLFYGSVLCLEKLFIRGSYGEKFKTSIT